MSESESAESLKRIAESVRAQINEGTLRFYESDVADLMAAADAIAGTETKVDAAFDWCARLAEAGHLKCPIVAAREERNGWERASRAIAMSIRDAMRRGA